MPKSNFYCQECGHRFATIKGAEKAMNDDKGCPKCGGADIDEGKPPRPSEGEAFGEAQ